MMATMRDVVLKVSQTPLSDSWIRHKMKKVHYCSGAGAWKTRSAMFEKIKSNPLGSNKKLSVNN